MIPSQQLPLASCSPKLPFKYLSPWKKNKSLVQDHPCLSELRTYTREFGQKMADLLPSFNKNPAMPAASCIDDSVVGRLAQLEMGEDDWSDAGLTDLLKYVYGAKGLVIPEIWKCCFPKEMFA